MASKKNQDNKVKLALTPLPYNAQAEKAVIGSAMIDKESLSTVLAALKKEDFYLEKNQLIYEAIYRLHDRRETVDILTVTNELINTRDLNAIGGPDYLQECCDSLVALSTLDFYINIVQNQACLRNLLVTIRDIDDKYKKEEITDINDFINESAIRLKEVMDKRRVSTFEKIDEVISKVQDSISKPREIGADNVTGLTSGFNEINKYTSGFEKTELLILAARPGLGKTALALNIAYRVATRTHNPVAIFSLEMSSDEIVKRLISCESHVEMTKIKTGNLTGEERVNVADAMNRIAKAPIYIDSTPNIPLMDFLSKCRKLIAKEPKLSLIIVDYLGLITGASTNKNESRTEEVRKISGALKGLAMELKVPVLATCQLSRNSEQRGDNKHPMLSDLRDSGSIEQDADKVFLMYREDYWKNQKDPAGEKKGAKLTDNDKKSLSLQQQKRQLAESLPLDTSYVEVNIAKNRNGQTGLANLFFYKAIQRFDDPPKEWIEKVDELKEKMNSNTDAL